MPLWFCQPHLMVLPHQAPLPNTVKASLLSLNTALQFGALEIIGPFVPTYEGSLSQVNSHLGLSQVADWLADHLASVAPYPG